MYLVYVKTERSKVKNKTRFLKNFPQFRLWINLTCSDEYRDTDHIERIMPFNCVLQLMQESTFCFSLKVPELQIKGKSVKKTDKNMVLYDLLFFFFFLYLIRNSVT